MSIYDLITSATLALKDSSSSPRLDAELLIAAVLKCERSTLISRNQCALTSDEIANYQTLLEQRRAGLPIAYLIGTREFYGVDFVVTNAVLVPRPETEHLVENVLAIVSEIAQPIKILELGTGSGCIAVSLTRELLHRSIRCSYLAIDLSAAALEVARQNVDRHELDDVISLQRSDWFKEIDDQFNLIISNPPYVQASEIQGPLLHEPKLALSGGADGLDAYREIMKNAPKFLTPSGFLALEIGADQAESLVSIANQVAPALSVVKIYKDLAGRDRGVVLRLSNPS